MPNPSVEIIADTVSGCGESPFWDRLRERLVWVDINGRAICNLQPSTGAVERRATSDFPTAIALRQDRCDAVVSFANGVSLFDLETGAATPLAMPDPTPGNRLNEAKCDARGRLWVGSMQTNLNPDGTMRPMDRASGALFRVDADGTVTQHSPFEIGISNTMAWTSDGATFYFGDTERNVIYAYDFNAEAGTVANRRPFFEGYGYGAPDGSCIDDAGCLWNARYGGGRIVRITPEGKVDREMKLPVTNPTCCAFGGADLTTLFVTSARGSLGAAALVDNPAEGSLLAIEGLGRGLPGARFAG